LKRKKIGRARIAYDEKSNSHFLYSTWSDLEKLELEDADMQPAMEIVALPLSALVEPF